jgi:hypothetical protein
MAESTEIVITGWNESRDRLAGYLAEEGQR